MDSGENCARVERESSATGGLMGQGEKPSPGGPTCHRNRELKKKDCQFFSLNPAYPIRGDPCHDNQPPVALLLLCVRQNFRNIPLPKKTTRRFHFPQISGKLRTRGVSSLFNLLSLSLPSHSVELAAVLHGRHGRRRALHAQAHHPCA